MIASYGQGYNGYSLFKYLPLFNIKNEVGKIEQYNNGWLHWVDKA